MQMSSPNPPSKNRSALPHPKQSCPIYKKIQNVCPSEQARIGKQVRLGFCGQPPDVDVTFRDPLLTRPTSHYVVGVDNLTVCSKALSMIEPVTTANHTDLIRVVRKPRYQ